MGCILLYTRGFRELVWVMAILWPLWLVTTNMTPFAMTFHNQLQAAGEHLRETWCVYARKQMRLFLSSYFCQLDISPFTANQDASKFAVLNCWHFDCSCTSTRSHSLSIGKFLCCFTLVLRQCKF